MSLRAYCAHQLMYRPSGTICAHFPEERKVPEYYPTLLRARRLFQQHIVDQAVRIEDNRLNWINLNQDKIRSDLYQSLMDAMSADDIQNAGRINVLPSSFTGGERSQYQHYQDGLAIILNQVQASGFITT